MWASRFNQTGQQSFIAKAGSKMWRNDMVRKKKRNYQKKCYVYQKKINNNFCIDNFHQDSKSNDIVKLFSYPTLYFFCHISDTSNNLQPFFFLLFPKSKLLLSLGVINEGCSGELKK